MARPRCPDNETLQRLLLGCLDEPERSVLKEHLLACMDCAATAETLHSAESLTEAIRRGESLGGRLDFLAPAQLPDELGRLGDYRVLKVLGVGGMGVVLLGEDVRLKRHVALKAIKPRASAKPDSKARFLREARATAALSHDFIVQIYQVGEQQGVPYIAMQHLDGESLYTRLKCEGRLPPAEVARIGRQVALGLAAAHEQGLIHRDIKPGNIWLEAKTRRAKILDFGLVRESTADAKLTQAGALVGTPGYMAPEQVLGQVVDTRCDLFSLGSMLYQLVAGQPPFPGETVTAVISAVAHVSPKPVQQLAPEIDAELAELIMRLLRKDPAERPQSAAEVARQLSEIEPRLRASRGSSPGAVPVQPRPRPAASRPPPFWRRPRGIAAAGAFALVLGIILITLRHRDGTQTTLRVRKGTAIDLDVPPGTQLTFDERPAISSTERGQPVARNDATSTPSSVQVSIAPPQLGNWSPGPAPPWYRESANTSGHSLIASNVLPGILERPAELPRIKRWNVDTRWGRGISLVTHYSPDGKWVAIGSCDGHVRIYDAETMKLARLLPGRTAISAVDDLSWAPDSQRLAVAIPNEKVARIWSIDGRLVYEDTQDVPWHSVAWSPQGDRIAEGFHGRIQLRRPDGQIERVLCEGDGLGPSDGGMLAWSPDGQQLASWQTDGRLVVWDCDAGTFQQLGEAIGDRGRPGHRLAWSRNGLLAVALGHQLLVYDSKLRQLQSVDYRGRGAIAWHPDGDRLFLWDGRAVQSWSVESNAFVDHTAEASPGWPHQPVALACSPRGDRITAAAGLVRVLSTDLKTKHFETPVTVRFCTSVAWSHDGQHLASTTEGFHAGIPVWDAQGKSLAVIPVDLDSLPLELAWSPSDQVLVGIAKGQHSIISRDLNAAEVINGAADTRSVAWNPDGTHIAFGAGNGTVSIFEKSGALAAEMIAGDGPAYLAWSPVSNLLIVHCDNNLYRCGPETIWKLSLIDEGSTPARLNPTWSPDGRLVSIPNLGWYNSEGTLIAKPNRPHPVSWRNDGRTFLGGGMTELTKHAAGGTVLENRHLNGTAEQRAYRYQPHGNLIAIAFGQSAITVLHDNGLQPYWHTVLLPGMRSATFTAAGELIDGDDATVAKHLVYYADRGDGVIEIIEPDEFLKEFAREQTEN